jgi:hypothetical protein
MLRSVRAGVDVLYGAFSPANRFMSEKHRQSETTRSYWHSPCVTRPIMGQQLSFKELCGPYQQRRPEKTILYQADAGHYRTFEAITAASGKQLPKYVTQEFEAFFRCGILAHGFLRLCCEDCKQEKIVAFSCKKRGFCSSCGGRRMAECAAHLVDEVFPRVGIRQWVLSFPIPVRFILAKNPKIQARCLTIVHRAITGFIKKKAKKKGLRASVQPGAVTLIQRFGGRLNLNVHYHMLFLEGGYYQTFQGPRYWWVDPPVDEEICSMVATLASRVVRFLKKQGYFQDECEFAMPEEEVTQEELFSELQAASVQSRIALGERKGKLVRRLGTMEFADFQAAAQLNGRLCAISNGFSLHAAVYCAPWEREKLEKLCRYIARPAVAEERLQMRSSGDIVLRLKTPYSDRTTHLLFSGLEFVEKLAALIPPPRIHLTRFFGCLAPHAKIRSQIVPRKDDKTKQDSQSPETAIPVSATPAKKTHRIGWAELLARVFAIDMKHCHNCGGDLKLIAAILEPSAIKKILGHLGLPDKPPDIAPARLPPQLSFS